MVKRSLQASPVGIQAATTALIRLDMTQETLKNRLGISRTTISKFFNQKPVDRSLFLKICKTLELDWQKVTRQPQTDVDALVQTVRESIRPYIQEKCGMMRVLDMEQPIGLGDIYTSVNILERITGRRGRDIPELMQDVDPQNFDRFCLGKVQEKRVPGLAAVKKFSKLMILGKPGAGKTTFLKHLAIKCIDDDKSCIDDNGYLSDLVPIFITLKDFAEADEKPYLLTYIERLLPLNSGGDRPNASPLNNILHTGKALILLDGLDEVREADGSRVVRQIREFSEKFSKNQFVITCRIAAQEYTFVQFTEVEIADFYGDEIDIFVRKWFSRKDNSAKAEQFLQKLKENISVQELSTIPLFLTLLCYIFEDSNSLPTKRIKLYEECVDALLKTWDEKRLIERDQAYQNLSSKEKEDLLIQIAYKTFKESRYFFETSDVEYLIEQFMKSLPASPSMGRESRRLQGSAVLRSIEAQHGFLSERAKGIWSLT